MSIWPAALLASLIWLAGQAAVADGGEPRIVSLHDDGGWCWFEDERCLIVDGKLIFGVVASGRTDSSRRGNIEVVSFDIASQSSQRFVLHERFSLDDHNSPALLSLDDGRLLAMYCKHGPENKIYYRISERPGNADAWGAEKTFVPSQSSRVTYSNLFRLANENEGNGRIYDLFRGLDASFKPSWMFSDDEARSWHTGGLWIDFPNPRRHRPYVKYASNGKDTIHFAFTEGHPRDFDNSLYHAFYRAGSFYRSDGAKIKNLSDGPVKPAEATRIFKGDADNVAWPCDLHLDELGHPVVVYSVQKDSGGLPPGQGGDDHRYRYARYNDRQWEDQQVAMAGSRLYSGEDDYTGLICLVPESPHVVYYSSNVDIHTGEPNKSGHYEIYRGETPDGGRSWKHTAITHDSETDNLRPIVPRSDGHHRAVLWLRGKLTTYTDFDLEVVGILNPGK